MTNDKALAPVSEQPDADMGQILELARALGPEGRETVAQLVQWRQQEEDRRAEREFNAAMARVHQLAPEVQKSAYNSQTQSWYAKVGDVARGLKPVYTAEGFSLVFGEEESTKEGFLRVGVDILHAAGHSKHRHIDLPPDDKGIRGQTNKTRIHAHASTMSYGQRYLIGMIFAPDLVDRDRDGNTEQRQEQSRQQGSQRQKRSPQQDSQTIDEQDRKTMFGIAKGVGLTPNDVAEIAKAHGYESRKDIPRGAEFHRIIRAIKDEGAKRQAERASSDDDGVAQWQAEHAAAEIEGEVIQEGEDT